MTPTALHERVGLSEDDGMRPSSRDVLIFDSVILALTSTIRTIMDLDLISLVRSGTVGSFP